MFRKIGGNGAFCSIDSARSFPIVGQVVGQVLRIGLLEIEFTLRHTEHKIVLQPGCFGEVDIIALTHSPEIHKIILVLLSQRGHPASFRSVFFYPL